MDDNLLWNVNDIINSTKYNKSMNELRTSSKYFITYTGTFFEREENSKCYKI